MRMQAQGKGGTIGVPVVSRPQLATGKQGANGPTQGRPGGLMGSVPGGSVQTISAGDFRKLRQEIQNLRDAN